MVAALLVLAGCGGNDIGSADTAENTVVNGNLWKALPAVKNGQVARVDDEVWFLGLGPLGAMDVLTDLERLLGPKG